MALTAFLILFILIGSVSAFNDNTTTISQNIDEIENNNDIGTDVISTESDDSNINEILKSNNENTTLKEPVGGGTFADIRDAIEHEASGGTIELSGIYKGDGNEIVIDKNNLTIIGTNDATLDAQGQSMIFKITGNGVILKNIKFINAKSSDNGGAIYWQGANGEVTNCNFTQNAAKYGGAIRWEGGNGTIIQCNFNNNKANEDGGAIHWGGANGTINKCNFNNNKANNDTFGSGGGAIYWYGGANGIINKCNFNNNTAEYEGGAIYLNGANGTVNNCTFNNNKAKLHGGAISGIGNNRKITNCNFNNNTSNYGGAIYWEGGANGEVTNCNFNNNTAQEDGGAIHWEGANGTVNNCTFDDNIAQSNGGAIYWRGTEGNIYNSTFKNNKAKNYRNIYNTTNLVLSDSTLETIVTISQIPDCDAGSSATVNITFDDGTNIGQYNVTLFNNNELIKTFTYSSTYNYIYAWENLAAGEYTITVGDINNYNNKYIADYEPMKFNVAPQHTYSIVNNKDMSVYYGAGAKFTVRIVDEKGNPVSGKTVIFKVNKKNVRTTVSDVKGYASVGISWKPGKYTISTTCEHSTVSNTIKVKKVLRVAKKVKVEKSAKKIVLKAKLLSKLKGKKIIFKFKGKKYTKKTNKKGIASVKINKKVLRKLKVGKKYSYSVVFGKEKAKGKVIVKK